MIIKNIKSEGYIHSYISSLSIENLLSLAYEQFILGRAPESDVISWFRPTEIQTLIADGHIIYGPLHREDGPAIYSEDGRSQYYCLYGITYNTKEEWFAELTPEQKYNYIWKIK